MSEYIIRDRLWSRYQELVRTVSIPYQLDALNDRIEDAEPSHCLKNFRIAAQKEKGEFRGWAFQDSDAAKWIEAVAGTLLWHPDKELENKADEVIDLICSVQQPDGYMDTYYIINGIDQKWTNLKDKHELYVAGHMIEAAIAYYNATGKRKLLDACIKLADLINDTFGIGPQKIPGYPGHPEIELALVKLYQLTEDEKYLNLAKYFIDQRGQKPLFFEQETKKYNNTFPWENSIYGYQYYQAGKPVREQKVAEGHAVRALYLYSGMTDVARMTNDASLQSVCETLWDDVTKRQMYITGAVGSAEYGESFSFDYNLPNDTVYGETCASIALFMFAWRMLKQKVDRKYSDIMELTLYNSIISGMQLDGKKFFYVNPLEVYPDACKLDHNKRHVKPVRQKWFGCACCPPNIARLLANLGEYICSVVENTGYLHLFIAGEATLSLREGNVKLRIDADYPRELKTVIRLNPEFNSPFQFAVRIPNYCKSFTISINGNNCKSILHDGYVLLTIQGETEIQIQLELSIRMMRSDPKVRENINKICIMRGPFVYCLEEADNGKELHTYLFSDTGTFEVEDKPELLGGVITIKGQADRIKSDLWGSNELYEEKQLEYSSHQVTLIPYYAWANRGEGEMMVWINAKR